MVYDSGKFNITLKKVIRRIEGLDNNSRIIWTKEILSELGSDVMSKTYHDGYEQGRFDEAMENTIKVKKVEIPDYIAHWLDYCKLTNVDFVRSFLVDKYCLYNYVRQSDLPKIKEWFKSSRNRITFIESWENGYTIKETYYYVAIPVGKGMYNRLAVNCSGEVFLDTHNYLSMDKLIKHSRQSVQQLTEDKIKESPLSWAWQFAKELED